MRDIEHRGVVRSLDYPLLTDEWLMNTNVWFALVSFEFSGLTRRKIFYRCMGNWRLKPTFSTDLTESGLSLFSSHFIHAHTHVCIYTYIFIFILYVCIFVYLYLINRFIFFRSSIFFRKYYYVLLFSFFFLFF